MMRVRPLKAATIWRSAKLGGGIYYGFTMDLTGNQMVDLLFLKR